MLLDEAHISMSLQHGNIVQVLDLGVASGRYFLALELVDGWDLEKILQRAHAAGLVWPSALALYVGAVVCRALAYAHAKTPRRQAAGDRSPRHQPQQRAGQRPGRGEAGRLRHRQGPAQARADRRRRHQGQGRVHVAGAGPGRGHRPALGHLLGRVDAVPDGDGQAAVRGGRTTWNRCCGSRRRTSRRPEGRRRRSGLRWRRSSSARCGCRPRSATRPPTRCWSRSSGCCGRSSIRPGRPS